MKQLIATLGIPLEDAKQGYKFLNADHKKHLKTKFISTCHKMKLPDVVCDSFTYQLDYKHQFDAFDVCHVMNAVLNNQKNLNDAALKMEVVPNTTLIAENFNLEENFWASFLKILERYFQKKCRLLRKRCVFRD